MQDQIPLRKWMLVCCDCWCCDGCAKDFTLLFGTSSNTGYCSSNYSRATCLYTPLRHTILPLTALQYPAQQFVTATVARRSYIVHCVKLFYIWVKICWGIIFGTHFKVTLKSKTIITSFRKQNRRTKTAHSHYSANLY
jgi:hypothetical protein